MDFGQTTSLVSCWKLEVAKALVVSKIFEIGSLDMFFYVSSFDNSLNSASLSVLTKISVALVPMIDLSVFKSLRGLISLAATLALCVQSS